ncbi:MAG: hypothetical protein J2P57_24805, partial [Acidimicrobiaceae bacterium]|nr:hypothetical protein [Acidimicrobiaceae bacterium]
MPHKGVTAIEGPVASQQNGNVRLAHCRLLPIKHATRQPSRRLARYNSSLRVAIVCDWLLNLGGGERVTFQFHRMFPDAPIYTSQYDPENFDWFSG